MSETKTFISKFTSIDKKKINSYHILDGILYFGSSPDGVVYKTLDGFSVSEFYRTGEYSITSIGSYGGALFIGTSSNGKIFMHNFNTGNRFHYVTTGDYSITSFCEYDDKLYAGTSPSGIIYSFDGISWKKEYDCYGGGIVDMIAFNNNLYVFTSGIEFIPCLTKNGWELMKNGDNDFSISSFKKVKTSLNYLQKNMNFDFSFSCAKVIGEKMYFAPENRCNLYEYDGKNVNVFHQFGGSRINSIEKSSDSQMFVSVDDEIFALNIKDSGGK